MVKKILFISLALFVLLFSIMLGGCFADAAAQMDVVISNLELGNYAEAEAETKKLIVDFAGHPHLPDVLYQVANEYQGRQIHEQAQKLYKYIIDKLPESEYVILSRVSIIMSDIGLGNYANAQTAIDKLILDFNGHPALPGEIYRIASYLYWGEKRYEDARRLYKSVLEKWSESEQAMWAQAGIASVDISNRDYPSARAAIKKLLDNYKDHKDLAAARFQLGSDYCRAGKYKEAQELYKQISEEHPGSEVGALARVGLGKIKLCLGGDEDARVIFDRVLADYAGRPILLEAMEMMASAYYNEALRMKKQGLDEQAKSYYQKTIVEFKRIMPQLPKTDDKAAEICYFSGVCYSRLGQHQKAIEYYRKVVDNWPDYKYAWHVQFMIGRTYKYLKETGAISESEADSAILAAYERVIQNYPDCPAAKAARGWLNYYHKKSSEGRQK